MTLDDLQVGARIRITKPVGYPDEKFETWREITWLPPRGTWADRDCITVGMGETVGQLQLNWPLERIEIDPAGGAR